MTSGTEPAFAIVPLPAIGDSPDAVFWDTRSEGAAVVSSRRLQAVA